MMLGREMYAHIQQVQTDCINYVTQFAINGYQCPDSTHKLLIAQCSQWLSDYGQGKAKAELGAKLMNRHQLFFFEFDHLKHYGDPERMTETAFPKLSPEVRERISKHARWVESWEEKTIVHPDEEIRIDGGQS